MTTIAVLGDSLSATQYTNQYGQTLLSGFYVDMIAATMKWTKLVDTAVGGLTLHNAVSHLSSLIPTVPDHLLINLGTNDAYHMSPTGDENATTYKQDWDTLFAYINGLSPRPTCTVLGLIPTLFGFGCQWAYNDRYLLDYLNMIACGVTYANGGYWVPMDTIITEMTRSDLHPNPRGHAEMAGLILKRWGVV